MDRKEAIKVIREYYPSSGKDLNEALETLVPELKESEDERIKNFLIGKFREIGEVWHEYSTKDIIAWLEKQGSQNLANSAKTCKDEQNPAWSGEDETGLNDAMWAIEQARTTAKDENDMGNLWYAERWLKSLKSRVQPQPKSEWSEEDKEALRVVTNIFEQHGVKLLCYPAFVHWLKTLPNRITFNPYWKPSDEQMEYLAKAITTLGNEGDNKTSAILSELRTELKKLKG